MLSLFTAFCQGHMASSQNRLLSQLSWSFSKKTSNLPPATKCVDFREPPQPILWKPRNNSDFFHISWKKFPGSFSRNLPPIQKARPTTTWLVKDPTICSVQLVSNFESPYPSNPFPNGTRRQWRQFITTSHLPSSFCFQVLAVGMWMLETPTGTKHCRKKKGVL